MGSFSKTLAYAYDLNGNRTQLTHPDSQIFTYEQDGLNRVDRIDEGTSSGLAVLGYTYNNAGNRNFLNRYNPWDTYYEYDPLGRLSALVQTRYGSVDDVRIEFTRNPASQVVNMWKSADSYAWGGSQAVQRTYAANGLNQYSSAGPASFCYDANGNLTADGASVYKYDAENRLIEKRAQVGSACPVTNYTGTLQASLSYDPMGRLFEVSSPTTDTKFLYDGDELVAEYNSSNALLRRYLHGASVDDPLIWYEGTALTDRRFLTTDERGSINLITDNAGATLAIDTYDEYGIPGASNIGRFQYTGQAWIPELGMYHYKARIYSPTLGRFLQTDPVGYDGGIALYAYVGNDPVNAADPSGAIADENEDPKTGTNEPIGPQSNPYMCAKAGLGCDEHTSDYADGTTFSIGATASVTVPIASFSVTSGTMVDTVGNSRDFDETSRKFGPSTKAGNGVQVGVTVSIANGHVNDQQGGFDTVGGQGGPVSVTGSSGKSQETGKKVSVLSVTVGPGGGISGGAGKSNTTFTRHSGTAVKTNIHASRLCHKDICGAGW